MNKPFMTREEASVTLDISIDTLDRKLGSKTLYSREDILAFADKLIRKGAISLA